MMKAHSINLSVNETQTAEDFDDERFIAHCRAVRAMIAGAHSENEEDFSREMKRKAAKKIWYQSVPLPGSIAETYLRQHNVVYNRAKMGDVRFNPSVLHEPTKEMFPAMIAPVHNLEGEFMGIHKTYLARRNDDGGVIRRMPCRLLGACHGSYIQLTEAQGFQLAITDSLEHGLDVLQACSNLSVWVAMTPGNLRSPLPANIKHVIISASKECSGNETNAKLVREAVRLHQERGVKVATAPDLAHADYSDSL